MDFWCNGCIRSVILTEVYMTFTVFSKTYRRFYETWSIQRSDPVINSSPTVNFWRGAYTTSICEWSYHKHQQYSETLAFAFNGTGIQGLEDGDPARRIQFCRFFQYFRPQFEIKWHAKVEWISNIYSWDTSAILTAELNMN